MGFPTDQPFYRGLHLQNLFGLHSTSRLPAAFVSVLFLKVHGIHMPKRVLRVRICCGLQGKTKRKTTSFVGAQKQVPPMNQPGGGLFIRGFPSLGLHATLSGAANRHVGVPSSSEPTPPWDVEKDAKKKRPSGPSGSIF